MKYISLFAGIGGFDLALNNLGHENVYTNEWDKYSAQTYEKNFGHRPDTRDITTVPSSDIPDHDLLVGGFPCQSFSIAGKRGGFTDTRGTLFFEIARILRDKRPGHFLLENVKGLLNHDGGKTIQTIFGVLSDLGYEFEWQVLNSKNFGVPQNRERIFIVGNLRGERRSEIFPFRGDGSQSAEYRDEQGSSNTLTGRSAGGQNRRGNYVAVGTLRTHKDGNGFREMKSGVAPTIPARAREDGSGQPVVKFKAMRWSRTEKGKEARREAQKAGKDYTPFNDGHRELVAAKDDVAGTITSQAIAKDSLLGNGVKIRRLTPIECERLQGFPDNWTQGVSDTQRYKQLGNAVTVNVVEEIVKRI